MDGMHPHAQDGQPESRWKWALVGFLAIAAFFLWTEHRAHLLGALPYLLILACPLMHLLHHGRHGHGQQRRRAPDAADAHEQVPTPGEPS